jgi:hypothetical protein
MYRKITLLLFAAMLTLSLAVPVSVPAAQAAGTIVKEGPDGEYVPCSCVCITVFGKKYCVCVCG